MNKELSMAVLLGIFLAVVPAQAQMQDKTGSGGMMNDEKMMMKDEAAPVEVGNTVCPVSGEKIKGKPVQVEYKGKIYNLCCKMCEKDFLKDPEKYSAIAEAQAKASSAMKKGMKAKEKMPSEKDM